MRLQEPAVAPSDALERLKVAGVEPPTDGFTLLISLARKTT